MEKEAVTAEYTEEELHHLVWELFPKWMDDLLDNVYGEGWEDNN